MIDLYMMEKFLVWYTCGFGLWLLHSSHHSWIYDHLHDWTCNATQNQTIKHTYNMLIEHANTCFVSINKAVLMYIVLFQ